MFFNFEQGIRVFVNKLFNMKNRNAFINVFLGVSENALRILAIWIWTLITCMVGLFLLLFLNQKQTILFTSKYWSWLILKVSKVKVKILGAENIPRDKTTIYVANHESSFDIPALYQALGVPMFFMVKSQFRKIPIFSWYLKALGMVFVNKNNRKDILDSLDTAVKEINKGKNLISFPEGTRSRDGNMKHFKQGTFVLAKETKVNIVPVAILGAREVNKPGYLIKSGFITLVIGPPIITAKYDSVRPRTYARVVEEKVKKMVANPINMLMFALVFLHFFVAYNGY